MPYLSIVCQPAYYLKAKFGIVVSQLAGNPDCPSFSVSAVWSGPTVHSSDHLFNFLQLNPDSTPLFCPSVYFSPALTPSLPASVMCHPRPGAWVRTGWEGDQNHLLVSTASQMRTAPGNDTLQRRLFHYFLVVHFIGVDMCIIIVWSLELNRTTFSSLR